MKMQRAYAKMATVAIVLVATIGGCAALARRFLGEIKGTRRDVTIECSAFDAGRLAEASSTAISSVFEILISEVVLSEALTQNNVEAIIINNTANTI